MRRGRRWRHPVLHLVVLPNALPHNRLGFAVGKRVGKAVTRNRVKRRLREALRRLPLRPGHDIVVSAHPQAAEADYWALRDALTELARRARLLERDAATDASAEGAERRDGRPRA